MIDDATLDEWTRYAYQAYGENTGFKNFQGNPMPSFDDLTQTNQDAWRAAVVGVVGLALAANQMQLTTEPGQDRS